MSLNLVAHGQNVGVNCVPVRGQWDVQDGPVGLWFTQTNGPTLSEGGLRGLHLDRPASDLNPHGLMWHLGGTPAWGMGMDYDSATYTVPDMVLLNAKPGATSLDYLRCRQDTGQIEIGFGIGHPSTTAQVHVSTRGPGVVNSLQLDGGLAVGGAAAITGAVATGALTVTGAASISGAVATGALTVTGNITATGTIVGSGGNSGTLTGALIVTTDYKTSTFAVGAGDVVLLVDGSSGAYNITLPFAVASNGRVLIFKRTDNTGNTTTIVAQTGDFINGGTTYALTAGGGSYPSVTLIGDGNHAWLKVASA